jgi:serine/threonine protein kinase
MYRVVGQLGQGGFSRVVRAEHRETGEQVAVKLIHLRRKGLDADQVRRMRLGCACIALAQQYSIARNVALVRCSS